VDDSGLVGIGIQPHTHLLEVNGSASKSTPGNWLGNSDARLKTNIEPLKPDETLSKLLEIKGVTYEWNDRITGVERPNGLQYGFQAQDVLDVFPELIVKDSNGYLQTSYGTFDPMILEGIRYIDQEIDSIKAEANKMLYRLDKLEQALKNEPKKIPGHKE